MNIVIVIGLGTIAVIVSAIVIILVVNEQRLKKKHPFTCIVIEKDGFGKPRAIQDTGGVYIDGKTQNKRFFLRRGKAGLDCNSVPYIPYMKQNIVFLRKIGSKNYQFLSFESIFSDSPHITVEEEDVNWAINDYQRSKQLIPDNSLLKQIMPFLVIGVTGVIILAMIVVVLGKVSVISDAAIALKEAANALAQAKSGTVILNSGAP